MSKGTDKTPPQIRANYSKSGRDNMDLAMKQLLGQGVPVKDVTTFATVAEGESSATSGQFEPLTKAAESIGAEITWH